MTVLVPCPLKPNLMCGVENLVYETPCPSCPCSYPSNLDALGTSLNAAHVGVQGLEVSVF